MAHGDFDGMGLQEVDHRLYEVEATAAPIVGWSRLTPEQRDAFRAQYAEVGFLSFADVFSPEACQAAIDGLADLCSNPPDGMILQFEKAAAGVDLDGLAAADRLDYVRKLMSFGDRDPRVAAMAFDPALLQWISELLGGVQPELYQDMALLKPPSIGREKPWHQDRAYFDVPESTPVVGVWIALDDVDLDNGGMVFQAGGHRAGPIAHFNRRDWQICDTEVLKMKGRVAAPLPAGGCLIFDGLIPHGTPQNTSGRRRRAVQFHYVPQGTPRLSSDTRLGLFGGEGRNVSC